MTTGCTRSAGRRRVLTPCGPAVRGRARGGRGAASRPELEKRRVSRGSGGSETRIFGEVRVLKKPADDRGAAGPARRPGRCGAHAKS